MTSLLTPDDLHYFAEGTHGRLASVLGAHPRTIDGVAGHDVRGVGAERRAVVGDRRLQRLGRATPPARAASPTRASGRASSRASATARATSTTSRRATAATASTRPTRSRSRAEVPPRTASIVWDARLRVGRRRVDGRTRGARNALDAPMSIYEVHLGSWRRVARGRQPAARLPRARAAARRLRRAASASPTSSCCRSWSTRSTARGATRRPATSRRRAATARRRTSCTSSTTCTSAASA